MEKNNQIPLMTRIYRDAAKVVVWLGAGGHGANLIRAIYHEDLHWDSRNHPSLEENIFTAPRHLRELYTSPW